MSLPLCKAFLLLANMIISDGCQLLWLLHILCAFSDVISMSSDYFRDCAIFLLLSAILKLGKFDIFYLTWRFCQDQEQSLSFAN